MKTKDTLSSCSDLDEQEIQQLQKQEKILKDNFMNEFNALKTTTQRLERQTFNNCSLFQQAFAHLFHTDVGTLQYELSQNMNNLEKQLNNEILHEKDTKSALRDKRCSGIVSDKGNDQVEKVDRNVIPNSLDMCDNEIQTDHNVVECDDERVVLANLIANLKLNVDENKKIQKQLKKANTSLTQEFKEWKSTLAKTSRTLGESNSIQDNCLVSLQNK
nr:hypothetical protein [Tanacetum cinerariifolium]